MEKNKNTFTITNGGVFMWKKRNYQEELKEFYKNWENQGYLPKSIVRDYQKKYQTLYHQVKHYHFHLNINKFKKFYQTLESQQIKHNQMWMELQKKNYKSVLKVKGYELDAEQQEAVLSEEQNILVLAGAGSGKSLTIIGKLKYLILVKKINPCNILCLTFTKEAVESLKKSVQEELNVSLEVLTFHKLGYQIIKQYEPKKKLTSSKTLSDLIDGYFEEIHDDEKQVKKLIHYFLYCIPYQVSSETATFDQKYKKLKKEEVILCNYFFYNQIPYQIRNHRLEDIHFSTIFLTNEKVHLQFYPLFNNYFETIQKIRTYHKKKETKLEEFYPIDFLDNTILQKLEELKKKLQLKLQPMRTKFMYQAMKNSNYTSYFLMLKKQLETFLHLLKANGGTIQTIEEYQTTASNHPIHFFRYKETFFLEIVKTIYLRYFYLLQDQNELDFDDMLLLSAQYIQTYGSYKKYQYILIDEYQDTSYSRYHLVKSLQDKTGANLFAVGDDWQSIYRFTGCNLDMFLNFSKYYGDSEILKIQTTYRNSQQLIDVAGAFIMKNKHQLKKHLHSSKQIRQPIKVVFYEQKRNTFKELLVSFQNFPKKDIFLLGRNHRDILFLEDDPDFVRKGNQILFRPYPELILTFYTVHASKGLEATNVILLNNEDNLLGFPNKILEDSVFEYLNQNELYPYEEERRLFYVALTRAKENCYLLVPKKNPSCFFLELQKSSNFYFEYFPGNKKQ